MLGEPKKQLASQAGKPTKRYRQFFAFIEQQYCKSSEDMILALTGQFKQLSQEPEKFR